MIYSSSCLDLFYLCYEFANAIHYYLLFICMFTSIQVFVPYILICAAGSNKDTKNDFPIFGRPMTLTIFRIVEFRIAKNIYSYGKIFLLTFEQTGNFFKLIY